MKMISFFILFFMVNLPLFSKTIEEKINFVSAFIKTINKKEYFSVDSENYFLGYAGGIAGMTLYNQLNVFDEKKMQLNKILPRSPIGTLLKKKGKNFFTKDDFSILYFCEVNPILIERKNKSEAINSKQTFIMILGVKRKDVMSVDNDIKICILAVAEHNDKLRIDLSYSSLNGQRMLDFLGFVPADNFTNIKISENTLNEIKETLRE